MSIPTDNNADAPPPKAQSASDPLLSAVEVARLMGVGIPTAVSYVLEMGLRSLDEGELIKAERFDLPLISGGISLRHVAGRARRTRAACDPPQHPGLRHQRAGREAERSAHGSGLGSRVTAIQSYRRERGVTDTRALWVSGRRPGSTAPPRTRHSDGFERPSAALAFSSSYTVWSR